MTLDNFTLALVDLQQDFWSPGIESSFPDLPSRMTQLRTAAGELGIRTVHLRARFSPDGSDWMPRHKLRGRSPCIADTAGESALEWGQEFQGEPVFYKQSFDGFRCPSFVKHLKETSTRFLVLAGLVTSTCVLLTAASAAQSGLLVAVVGDACGDRPDVHDLVLKRYAFMFEPIDVGAFKERIHDWDAELAKLSALNGSGK